LSLYRKYLLLSLFIIIPLGLATKVYSGPFGKWVNIYGGGILYEIFWCITIAMFFPDLKILYNVAAVFLITCMLEFLQLWHPVILENMRSFFIGRVLIGTTFSAYDFIYYSIGSAVSYAFLCCLRKSCCPHN